MTIQKLPAGEGGKEDWLADGHVLVWLGEGKHDEHHIMETGVLLKPRVIVMYKVMDGELSFIFK